jgi:hypothetical protein
MVFEAAAGAEHEPSEQHRGAGPVRGRVDLSYQVPGSVVQVAIEWGERKHVVAVGGAAAPLASKAEFEAVVIGTVHLLLAGRGDAEFASLGDPVEVAERVAALVPSPHPMSQLGPFYTTRAVRTWLGITRQALDQRVRDRKVLGCPTANGGQRVYPTWQFTSTGDTIPHLREVLDVLAAGIADPWTWTTWLATPVPGRFDGKPAYRWLAERDDPAAVLAQAQRIASRLAH